MKRKKIIYLLLIFAGLLTNPVFISLSQAQSNVKELIDKLSSPDKNVRSISVQELNTLAKENSEIIRKCLSDDKRELVRYYLIDILSKLGNQDDYDIIKKHLKEDSDELKIAAIYGLVRLNSEKAGQDLSNIYPGVSYEVKKNIIYASGETRNEQNIEFLAKQLFDERSDIRDETVIALAKIGGEGVLKHLINYMNRFPGDKQLVLNMPKIGTKLIGPLITNLPEGETEIWNTSKEIIEKIIDNNPDESMFEIVKFLSSEINPVSRIVKELIKARINESVKPAIKLFKSAKGKLKDDIIGFLSNHPNSDLVIKSLIEIWKDLNNDEEKIQLIDILLNLKRMDIAIDFLVCNITNPSPGIRSYILEIMQSDPNIFVPEIVKSMARTKDNEMKKHIKDALITLKGYKFDFVLGVISNEEFRADAEDVLLKLDYKALNAHLVQLFGQDKLVNFQGKDQVFLNPTGFAVDAVLIDKEKIRLLLIKKASDSIESLIEGLKDKNKKIVSESRDLLLRIGAPTVPFLIQILKDDTDDVQTSYANDILFEMGEKVVPELINELAVDDLWSKMNIANLLIRFKRNEAVPAIIAVLGTDDTALQYRAIYALRDIGDSVIPELVKNMDNANENMLIGVVRTLGEIKDKSAVSYLKEKLDVTQNEKIKKEIEKALNKIGS